MQASALRLLCGALLFHAACVGRVGEVASADVDAGVPDADAGAMNGQPGVRPDSGRPKPPSDCPNQPLARGMRMKELAMYQTVKVSLFEDGGWHHAPSRSAAIIRGKEAFARVFVELEDDYEPHTVRGVLRLKEGDEVTTIVDTRTVREKSSDEDLGTTFNFPVKSSQISENTEISIALEEPTCQGESGPASATRYPEDGRFEALEAAFVDDLHIKLVPIASNGRTPSIDPLKREEMRKTLLAYYPVPEVVIEPHDAIETTIAIDNVADQPWHDMLQEVLMLRARDHVPDHVYYVGLVQPDESMRTFCQNGCYLGIAPTTPNRNPRAQVALVAIFPDSPNFEAVVHELGHAHGRGHAPCASGGAVPNADPNYPLPTGAVESWGWDFRTRTLMEPEVHMDVMGYCEPNWISTYTYSALVDRSQEVNGDALFRGIMDRRGRHVVLEANGDARWGKLDADSMPGGELESAEVLDAAGKVVTTVPITRVRLSHTQAQWAFIPEPKAGWTSLRLSDRIVRLDDIK
ncbi:MAG: hypothetical protein ABW252_25905 [Polyangiales bacterium]